MQTVVIIGLWVMLALMFLGAFNVVLSIGKTREVITPAFAARVLCLSLIYCLIICGALSVLS